MSSLFESLFVESERKPTRSKVTTKQSTRQANVEGLEGLPGAAIKYFKEQVTGVDQIISVKVNSSTGTYTYFSHSKFNK